MSASVETALNDRLSNDAALDALVDGRIFAMNAPQGAGALALPDVVYRVISGVEEAGMLGSEGLRQTRVQVNCRGKTFADAIAVAAAVRNCLQGFKGVMGTPDSGNEITVQSCLQAGQVDLDDLAAGHDQHRVYTRAVDFLLWHPVDLPTLT